jgi:ribosomal protein L37AE/L43A
MDGRRSRKARRDGTCPRCRRPIVIGARIIRLETGGWVCVTCAITQAPAGAARGEMLAQIPQETS